MSSVLAFIVAFGCGGRSALHDIVQTWERYPPQQARGTSVPQHLRVLTASANAQPLAR